MATATYDQIGPDSLPRKAGHIFEPEYAIEAVRRLSAAGFRSSATLSRLRSAATSTTKNPPRTAKIANFARKEAEDLKTKTIIT